jgi:hypothetical protein
MGLVCAAYPRFTVALSAQSMTEPQACVKECRSIHVIAHAISQTNASVIRARQPLPFPNLVQHGTYTEYADSLP